MTEIARRPAGALAVNPTQTDWTPDQRAALDALGIDGAEPGDLKVFLSYAQRTGLDPFARQIYLIGRNVNEQVGGQWRSRRRFTIQVGIDGFRVIAARTGKYRGQAGPEWCGDDGVWRDVWLSSGPPAAARVAVLHADFDGPLWSIALLSEYMPTNKKGEPSGLWARMPALMLAKVAEALSMRKAFPADLSGVYVAEEMDQAPPPAAAGPNAPPRSVDEITAEADVADAEQLRAIWREARDQRQMEIVVADKATGELMHLRAYLERRAEQLRGGNEVVSADPAAATQPGGDDLPIDVVDAETVDAETVDAETVDGGDPWKRAAPGGAP